MIKREIKLKLQVAREIIKKEYIDDYGRSIYDYESGKSCYNKKLRKTDIIIPKSSKKDIK